MNVYMENEASPLYRELVNLLDRLTPDEWLGPETERRMWDFDDALSQILTLRRDVLDEH